MASSKFLAIGLFSASIVGLFTLRAQAVVIQFVPVGDVGNVGDTQKMKQDQTSGYGAVPYAYQIGKYDVTNAQYTEFLNAKDPTGTSPLGLYNSAQGTDGNSAGISYNAGGPAGSKYAVIAGQGNKPAVNVDWFSSIRFINWLGNGQGNGATESGSYTLLGGSPTPANSSSVTRNAGATIFMPNENEWYKAAYYKAGGTNAGYWAYATRTNTTPVSAPPGSTAPNTANYNDPVTGYSVTGSTGNSANQNYLTDVGAYGNSASAYNTFDQTGNVFQWNETTVTGTVKGIRGGSWNLDSGALPSLNRDLLYEPTYANFFVGFRVAGIPEPVGATAWLMGGILLTCRARTRRREKNTWPQSRNERKGKRKEE